MNYKKVLKFGLPIIALCYILDSCTDDRMKNCIKGMQNEGYTYEEACDACEDAAYESQIR